MQTDEGFICTVLDEVLDTLQAITIVITSQTSILLQS